MAKRLPRNAHFQLRLVKRLDGRHIVTHPSLGQPNEGAAAKDHTLDMFDNERSALQAARNYCARGEKRKGPLPGEFLGVVMVKFESDPSKWRSVKPGALGPRWKLSGRPRRAPGTATWLYYVSPDETAFHVDPVTHEIGSPVPPHQAAASASPLGHPQP